MMDACQEWGRSLPAETLCHGALKWGEARLVSFSLSKEAPRSLTSINARILVSYGGRGAHAGPGLSPVLADSGGQAMKQ